MLTKLWNDEMGAILSSEIVLIGTILVIGMITGLASLRDAVIEELADVGQAFGNLDQSFNFGSAVAHSSSSTASCFQDTADFCDTGSGGGNSRCLVINGGQFACPLFGGDTGHN